MKLIANIKKYLDQKLINSNKYKIIKKENFYIVEYNTIDHKLNRVLFKESNVYHDIYFICFNKKIYIIDKEKLPRAIYYCVKETIKRDDLVLMSNYAFMEFDNIESINYFKSITTEHDFHNEEYYICEYISSQVVKVPLTNKYIP